jgi:signal transduction histidine kinase
MGAIITYAARGHPYSSRISAQILQLLERLADDLRLLTLAEGRKLHFESKPVDLGNPAQHVVDLFDAGAREKNISLSLNRRLGDLIVPADAQRTEKVIANLVSNSIRYAPKNGRDRIDNCVKKWIGCRLGQR